MKESNLNANIVFGAGALDRLTGYKDVNVTIVTDPALKKLGSTDALVDLLPACNVSIFDKIYPDPSTEQVAECYRFIAAKKTDVVIAFGGGSAIDTVKAVILVDKGAHNGKKTLEFVAIPTTSGTGSEVTSVTVITNTEAGRKVIMADPDMRPDYAILDYTLTKSVPANVTAFTGMDVITHAMEAYVAKNANPLTDAFAEKALTMAFTNLPVAVKNGNDDAARENMMMASYMAGLAFDGAGLGICHSIAHALGGAFHLPHGELNAIVLPHVVAFNSGLDVPFGTDKSESAVRYAEIARKIGLPMGGTRLSVQNLVRQITSFLVKFNIPTTLMQAGVTPDNFRERRTGIIEAALADLCTQANPKTPDAGDIGKLLDKIFYGA